MRTGTIQYNRHSPIVTIPQTAITIKRNRFRRLKLKPENLTLKNSGAKMTLINALSPNQMKFLLLRKNSLTWLSKITNSMLASKLQTCLCDKMLFLQ